MFSYPVEREAKGIESFPIALQSSKVACLLKMEAHQELLRPAVLVLAELERRAQATFFDVQSELPCDPQWDNKCTYTVD